LTDEELEAQRTKQYPNMMPPEDSFKFKLLTSRGFHVWFSMVRPSLINTVTIGDANMVV
jgi:hypothetical protein